MKKSIATIFYLLSIVLFVLGLINPILKNSTMMGFMGEKFIYLFGSIEYFFAEEEFFIGTLILVFTFIFPILKYLFIGFRLINMKFGQIKWVETLVEIVNKWAMLDVFVIALVIVNMKFNTLIISTSIEIGTTFFAISVLLLMTASYILRKHEEQIKKPSLEH
ncbi:MAG: paraquat-inducible protein A [Saprospiraceae bacterium]